MVLSWMCPGKPGVAANVKLEFSQTARYLALTGSGDYIEAPALTELKQPSLDYDFGETLLRLGIQTKPTTRLGEQLDCG
jgi:hypothetical protein